MGRDRLVDEIARAMARAENASEDHFEAYRHVAEAVAAVVEPLLAEKDAAEAALAELVRLKDGPRDAAYEEAKPYAWAQARLVLSEASPVSLDEPAVSGVGSTGVVPSEGADQLASPCSHCDGHGLMQTGYTGTLQYCGECNACDGSGTVPVVTDEERAALRSACSKCGGLVRLELRCEACGDLPAVEGMGSWTEWRATWDGDDADDEGWFRTETEAQEEQEHVGPYVPAPPFIEQRTVWVSRPVRVEEQGE